jgi:hypothetical protein
MLTSPPPGGHTPAAPPRTAPDGPVHAPWRSDRVAGAPWLLLALAAGLALFLGKSFCVDEPMYLWNARQIAAEPGDFFGLDVNWFGRRTPMPVAMMNPPLFAYYLAGATRLVGSSELAVHAVLLVFPLAAALGIASLARRLHADPAIALLATAATPAFVVSGSSAMSDMMMLALWVWAVDQWLSGVREKRGAALLRSGALIAGAVLAKFYGIALVPLLASHALATRASGRSLPVAPLLASLAIPLAVLFGYERLTSALYGAPHFASAMAYAERASLLRFAPLGSALIGLAFAGGCFVSALCFAPLLWSWRAIAAGLALGAAGTALIVARPELGGSTFRGSGLGLGPAALVQVAVLAAGGLGILALAALDLLHRRDADALLLALWVAGTFALAAFLTWSESARANLPMAPAVGLLIARRLAGRTIRSRRAVAAAALASLALAVAVAHADARLADSAREAAAQIADRYGAREGRLWFLGHWGFQYYLEEHGGVPVDARRSQLHPGDVIAIPSNNSGVFSLPIGRLQPLEMIEVPASSWLATMGAEVGAGLYSSVWGPLPWAFGEVPPERYAIFAVREPIEFPLR